MDIAAEADTSLASFRQEWQKILQDSNLPRRIERHHHFSERFGPACESHMKRCEEFERLLQSPAGKEKQTLHGRDAQEEPISELWALLQSLEKETMDLAKRSARIDNESAESTDTQQDILEAAFAAFSRFHAVRRKLVKRLERPLSVEVDGAGAAEETGTAAADESDNRVADSGHTGFDDSKTPQSDSQTPKKPLRRSKRRNRKE